jgi:monoamine oxidase
MRGVVNRRRFLELLSAAGLGAYLGGCTNDGPLGVGTTGSGGAGGSGGGTGGGPKKILVLGGGLGGLSAAYELMKAGHDVTVLEGQAKVGGRVSTYREGFAGGQFVEEGAVRVPDVHEHTVGYCNELGLNLIPFEPGDPLYYVKGVRFKHEDGKPWPLPGLMGDEKDLGLDKYDDYVKAFFEEFGNWRKGEFPKMTALDKYNAMTWTEFLKSKGASDDWLALYTSDNGTEITKIGALIWMATEVADYEWDVTYHVEGGNDLIAKRLQEKLGERVLLERKVTKIEHSDTGVTVTFDNAGKSETLTADRLVCALPFTTLRKVEISPAFTAEKTGAINDLYMMTSSRGYFQTKTRFWKNEGIGGVKIAKTDTPAERLWDLSNVQAGTNGMIMAYMQYNNAIAYDKKASAMRQSYLEGIIDGFFPGFAAEVVAFHQKSWALDPWVEGAWTDLLPNQWNLFDAIRKPESTVHFAGEHTSIWAGWMQGAIESGKRCAEEIIAV